MSRLTSTLALAGLICGSAHAQDIRPGDQPLDLPSFKSETEQDDPLLLTPLPDIPDAEPVPRESGTVLPPFEIPTQRDMQGLKGGVRVLIREIMVTGNTALPDADVRAIVDPYLDRELGYEEIQSIRDQLTLRYVSAGYVTSGAIIPTQSLAGGVLRFEIIEGFVRYIQIEIEGHLHDQYVRSRIERSTGSPLNVYEVERRLRLLEQDPRIEQISASVIPGDQRGEAELLVSVVSSSPWHLGLSVDNYSPPSVGEYRGSAFVGNGNVTGFGDVLSMEYSGGEGLNDVKASWMIPLNRYDTSFELFARHTWTKVVQDPFDTFDIEGKAQSYGIAVRQPVYRSINAEFDVFISAEWRRSVTRLLGERFSFVPGPDDGEATIVPLRVGIEWTHRSTRQVLAVRSSVNIGLDALSATQNSGNTPDGEFVFWLTQTQFARRLPFLESTVIARAEAQISNGPLLGLEQFSIGGHRTVRGYRENTLVRDSGVVGTLEYRVPVPMPRIQNWQSDLSLISFVDAGYSWNMDGPENGPTTLVSIGIGGLWAITDQLDFEITWAYQLKDLPTIGDKALQDDGIQFSLTWNIF